jgi:2-C-methyl-D-erythritol 4-phosphate cytidylyltransferase
MTKSSRLPPMKLSIILLAGGKGTRMGSAIPKVFLPLNGKPIALHSFKLFQSLPYVQEIIVVCPQDYYHLFPQDTLFAHPGEKRQDSVKNGFEKTSFDPILIHDAARPFVTKEEIDKLLKEGLSIGAATLGIPMKYTIKEVSSNRIVKKTLDRSLLYAMQTPQLLKRDILQKGLDAAQAQNLTVTDDVALAELIQHPVKIIPGFSRNIKITTPEDFQLAQSL